VSRTALNIWATLVILFLIGPLVVIVAGSFTEAPHVTFPPEGFTLKWYAKLMGRNDFLTSFIDSIILAVVATVAATLLGTITALAMARESFAGREIFRAFLMSPLILPTVVTGVALFQLLRVTEIQSNMVGLIVGHTLITLPYVIRTVGAAVVNLDPSLAEAAESLGARAWQVLFKVVMPAIAPAILVSVIFAFIVSFDQVTISIFLTGPDVMTLPIRIFTYIEFAIDPMIAAVSTLLILFAYALVVALERAFGLDRVFGKKG
jgi:putative spermidine/putrescine transport system permease protein